MGDIMKNTVIFDLDGTLLNTLDDLCDSTNRSLEEFSLPSRSLDEIRSFVGNGIRLLIERAVPKGTEEEVIDKVYYFFCDDYKKNMENKTAPYPYILEMLKEIKKMGFKTAIVTNKADFAAQTLCKKFFGEYIDLIVGSVPERRNKPYPDGVYYVLERLNSKKEETVFVGDSDVDIQTAKNSEVYPIGVLWGFRDKKNLESVGVKTFADTPQQLVKQISYIANMHK